MISPTARGIGGVAKVVQGLSNFLKKNNHDVDIISSENTFTIPIKGLKNPSFIISSFLKTKLGKKYDIVHAHNPPAAIAMKNVSGKKVLSIWGLYSDQVKSLHGKATGVLSDSLEKKALSMADIVLVASKEIQNYYSNLGYNVQYIPNAIDLDDLPTNQNRIYENQIIYAGRLSKEKGIYQLVSMCEKLPENIDLLILGTGPEEETIKQLINKKRNIHYLGFQPKEKTIPLIRGSDILIQPSLMEGGVNTTLLEAMACKIPILTTSLEVHRDAIRHMETAFCTPTNSSDDLLEGIITLMNNKKLGERLAENAYQEVQKFSWEVIGKKYLTIYEKLIHAN